jgi:hypothetical protein
MVGFIDLPAELRNKIYENRVLYRTKAGKRKMVSVTGFRVRHQQLMSLILADKQIGSEMLPVFFGGNLLHLVDRRTRCPGRPNIFFADGDTLEENDRRIVLCYSVPDCVQCPDDIAHRLLGGRKIELPPLKWRHMFKHVKLTLHAPGRVLRPFPAVFRPYPNPKRHSTEDRDMWYHQNMDWLFPIRELTALGFGQLHFLNIEVQPEEMHPTFYELETLETWVKEKINGMQIDAMEIKLSIKSRGRRPYTFLRL